MKKLLLPIALLFLTSCGVWINPRFANLPEKKQHLYEPIELSTESEYYNALKNRELQHQLFKIDTETLKQLLSATNKDYVYVIFYAKWCGPCRENNKIIKKLYEGYNERMDIFFISTSDYLSAKEDVTYLQESLSFPQASFVINTEVYGDRFRPWERMNKFINEFVPKSEFTGYPLPTGFLFDAAAEVIYEHSGVLEMNELTEILK